MKHCGICGEEFTDIRDTWDHGHDKHGLFHFIEVTVDGPRPKRAKYAQTEQELEEAVEAWRLGYLHEV